jgi:putative flippase GtrA
MNENKFSFKDIIVSLVVGEIAAWLLLVMTKSVLSPVTYEKYLAIIKLLPVFFPLICAVGLMIAYLIGKKIAIIYQIAKFVLIGGLNTLVDWGILSLLILIFRWYFAVGPDDTWLVVLSISIAFYTVYKAISFVLSATNSYFWNKFWTFKRETNENTGKEFMQFLIVTLIGFLINVGIASGIFKWIHPIGGLNGDQWALGAAVVATAVSMIWNFIGYKFIVFEQKLPVSAVPTEPSEKFEQVPPPGKKIV